ncbi:intraflagellar transport protein 81 homolog [Rhopilema esculentum]|uniref:intraflagellar transport protein 81 homolog n=1 Tax=Rhopilema esculentum TaxID=499914 RepID=UPI0031DDE906|eukprot:gene16964-8463_t
MSDQLKFIVDNLNSPPFNRNYNLISFDSLPDVQLLQVLNDVFTEINPQQASDIRQEDPEQRVVRMFSFLRMLKYKPPSEGGSLTKFRQGLVQGDKHIIYPVLQYLLEKLPDLKKRAYVARYLVKLEVPGDILVDAEVNDAHVMYLDLMEKFKETHKESEDIKQSGLSASEIKKDILAMEEEREQLLKRIERVKRRVDSIPSKDGLLQSAALLRKEREREKILDDQKAAQRNQLNHAQQKLQRLTMQLQDIRTAGMGITAEGLVKKVEEENQVNSYMCHDKIPKEIEAKKKYIENLQKVANSHAMTTSDLDSLTSKIKDLSAEINSLVEKRMVQGDPIDDKLSVFRQQAAVISNKKSSAAEKMQEATDELHNAEEELKEKKQQLKETDGVEILKGDDFKRYVNKLRGKSTAYKKKRQELAELRAENGVLSRTEDVLKGKDQHTQALLSSIEGKHGVSGFHETQEELEKISTLKSELDEEKGKTLEEISQMVVQLTNTIAEKKSNLAPVIKELRPLRQQCQELTVTHEERKAAYDSTLAGLESNSSKLEQEVKAYREESMQEESRYHYIQAMIKIMEGQQKKIADEVKSYVSSDGASKKSLRDQYTQKIHEQENHGKALREKQKSVRDNHVPRMKQMKMWKDLAEIMRCKKECVLKDQNLGAQKPAVAGMEVEDRLVLS